MSNVRQLFSDVYLIEGTVGRRPLQLPLLIGSPKSVLLDTGSASDVEEVILPALEEVGLPPERLSFIVNTHCDLDHQGGNYGMKQLAPQALLCCGDADRAQIESPEAIFAERYDAYREGHDHYYDEEGAAGVKASLGRPQAVDLTFSGGERLRLGKDWEVEVIHLPGHSRGHLGLLDPRHRALYGGDAIHGAVYLDLEGKPALCPTYLYVRSYLQTTRFIEYLDIDTYSGCHWPVKRGEEIEAFCVESRQFVAQAERLILQAIRKNERGKTLTELCYEVGPKLGDWPEAVNHELCFAVSGHLHDLKTGGHIARVPGTHPTRYRPRSASEPVAS